MMRKGAFTFVLHSHLPYCRRAGRWPHGEEWLHEGAADTYLPLLIALHDLAEEGCPYHLTIGLTPVLCEQLADAHVLENLEMYLRERIERARWHAGHLEQEGDLARSELARFWAGHYAFLLDTFINRFGRQIVPPFRHLQDRELIEVSAGAATHGYLPLLERDSAIHAQVAVGVQTYRRHFNKSPSSFWLPECAYRPTYATEEGRGYVKPGLHEFLAQQHILCFFAETHAIEGGLPVGKAMGDAMGPYGDVPRRYLVPMGQYPEPTLKTTYLPYWVSDPRVAAIGRNNRTGLQVWSAEHGYPGDYHYREFHKKDGASGLHYWKVTGARVDLGDKELYNPARAQERMHDHSRHFASLVEDLVRDFYGRSRLFGIVSAAYDTELFGHWWFEGVGWLREVLRILSRSEDVELTTASRHVREHPPEDVLALPESSWGQAGNHFTWLNTDTEWVWPLIGEAQLRMEGLVARYPEASGPLADALNQAGRELLLLESSDWPFLITTWQARDYATNRFQDHLERFHRLADMAEYNQVDEGLVAQYFDLDRVFLDLDYHDFANRERVNQRASVT
jgi:1,4-alpha-glucan branching enzyme